MNKSSFFRIFLYILAGLILAFIWGNSILPPEASGELSSGIESWLANLLGLETLPFDIRKLAHFCEYAVFGGIAALLLYSKGKPCLMRIYCLISTGLFAAVIDESIQILSDRGPMVSDVLLDFSGYLFGFGVIFLLLHLIVRPKRTQ